MAGQWSLLINGGVRLVSDAQLIELLEQDAISRYARVKREPDGEWISAERAVAKARRRLATHAAPAQKLVAVESAHVHRRRRLWPWLTGGSLIVALLVGIAWIFRIEPAPSATVARNSAASSTTAAPSSVPQTPEATPQTPAASVPHVPPASTEQPAATSASSQPMTVASTSSSPMANSEPTLPEIALPVSEPYGERQDANKERPDATDAQLVEFIASVEFERTADRGVSRVSQFIDQYRLSQKQALQIGDVKRRFDDRQKKGLVRLGTRWVTPEEQQKAQSEARSLIQQAYALTDLGSLKAAEELLSKASSVDGNNIEASLVLGMLNAIVYLPDASAKLAETSFETALKRSPDHLGALNNAAVVEIRQKRYSQAIDHLERAAEVAPRCREVAQNLGRLTLLSAEGRISLTERDRKRCSQIYARLIEADQSVAADPKHGYLLMLPYVSPAERSENPVVGDGDLVFVGYGTGFVIAPELILTNRHVVTMDDDPRGVADEVRIDVPSGRDVKRLTGVVKAVCATDDLAVVHVPGLSASPLNLRTSQAELAEEVGILGFPRTDQTGADLKFVGGRVAGVNTERMLFDCSSNQGNSGGPVLSKRGDVVAVLSAVQFVGDEVRTQYGRGVPSPAAIRFCAAHIASLPEVKPIPGEWPGIVGRVRGSIFKIDVYFQSTNPGILRSRVASTGIVDWLEDPSCPRCSGRGAAVCPGGCVGGDVQDIWFDQKVGTILGRTVLLPDLRSSIRSCTVCGGRGAVECPHCFKGIDPTLLP